MTKMTNYKITIQYEGTRYQGWQRQDSTGNTIQGKLETILAKMTGLDLVQVDGSGRTDAGVHALGQVANFKIGTELSAAEVMDYINQYLPEDIGVVAIQEVPERFHSRLNAKGKTYRYRIWNTSLPCVFARRYVYALPEPLDLDAMRATVRTIDSILIDREGSEVVITYSGDGFLYHMVRILTGTLIEVGLGQRSPASVEALLEKDATRDLAGALVPAKGLCLVEVRY